MTKTYVKQLTFFVCLQSSRLVYHWMALGCREYKYSVGKYAVNPNDILATLLIKWYKINHNCGKNVELRSILKHQD